MKHESSSSPATDVNWRRRQVLGGLLTTYTATLIPWAVAQPVPNDQQGAFMALSAILVGRKSLDNNLAQRFYDALVAEDTGFPAASSALLTLINEQRIDPMALQATLDTAHPALAPLPRRIVTAWYVGVVGDGSNARCLAYEDSLMSEVVKDKLVPPSYSYGAYGTWEDKPV
jgi:hypothetical protein